MQADWKTGKVERTKMKEDRKEGRKWGREGLKVEGRNRGMEGGEVRSTGIYIGTQHKRVLVTSECPGKIEQKSI